jgi:hypothetical protein
MAPGARDTGTTVSGWGAWRAGSWRTIWLILLGTKHLGSGDWVRLELQTQQQGGEISSF